MLWHVSYFFLLPLDNFTERFGLTESCQFVNIAHNDGYYQFTIIYSLGGNSKKPVGATDDFFEQSDFDPMDNGGIRVYWNIGNTEYYEGSGKGGGALIKS